MKCQKDQLRRDQTFLKPFGSYDPHQLKLLKMQILRLRRLLSCISAYYFEVVVTDRPFPFHFLKSTIAAF